jgi:DNA-binding NarL/FixJ family response regulator
MPTPLTVTIVDDHTLLRDGLRAFLSTQDDVKLVGEAADADSAYTVVEKTSPDVVVLDVSLPGANGIAVTRELLRRDAHRKILLLSMHLTEDVVAEGLSAGALGYIGKDQPASEIISAIRTVGQGQTYLSPRVSRFVVENYIRQRRGEKTETTPLGELSPREREVFDMLLNGFSNENIANHLGISRRTVETHRAHIMKKLNLHSVSDLFLFAARHGVLRV